MRLPAARQLGCSPDGTKVSLVGHCAPSPVVVSQKAMQAFTTFYDREAWVRRDAGIRRAAAAIGLALGLLTSAAVALERITTADVRVALITSAVLAVAAISLYRILRHLLSVRMVTSEITRPAIVHVRRFSRVGVLTNCAFGLVVALALGHGVLRLAAPWPDARLRECPAQAVNDGLVALAILAGAWGAASRRVTPLVLLTAALVGYGATAARWHLDVWPTRAPATVQQLVLGNVALALAGLAAYLTAVRHVSRA